MDPPASLMVPDTPPNTVPHEPPTAHPQKIRLSPDEVKVLRECNRESFYFRCVPFSAIAMAGTHFAVKAVYLRPNPRWGSTLKVLAAGVVGYVAGKFSYQQKCVEKIMQLPNSHLGEALRQKQRRGNFDSSLEIDMSEGQKTSDDPLNLYVRRDRDSIDIDKNVSYEGLDDSMRPSLDRDLPANEDVVTPIPARYTTYEELRDKNRAEYDAKKRENYLKRQPTPPKPTPPVIPPPSAAATPLEPEPGAKPIRQRKGKYGDVWDE